VHFAEELTALATEVIMARRTGAKESRTDSDSKPSRKRSKSNPLYPESLRGALNGVRVFITHCKDDGGGTYDRPINHINTDQVRALVEMKGLRAEILAADQGMRIEI